jgi:hypothetical protein
MQGNGLARQSLPSTMKIGITSKLFLAILAANIAIAIAVGRAVRLDCLAWLAHCFRPDGIRWLQHYGTKME